MRTARLPTLHRGEEGAGPVRLKLNKLVHFWGGPYTVRSNVSWDTWDHPLPRTDGQIRLKTLPYFVGGWSLGSPHLPDPEYGQGVP